MGTATAALLDRADREILGGYGTYVVPAVALLMVTVGLLATAGPALRGLRIDPTEALKTDA
jgi:ABC-type antimicrobial peptide transport system permease subunit